MGFKVIVDDVASTVDTAGLAALSANADIVVSALRDPDELETTIASGFAAEEAPAAIVTTDARLGSLAGGARRVADIGLLNALIEDPHAEFQYFVLWTQPDQLAAGAAALAAGPFVPVHRALGEQGIIVGIAEGAALRGLAASGARVAALGPSNLPETHDLYLMRDPAPDRAYLDRIPQHGALVLLSTDEGLFVAVPADTSIEDLHFPVTRHGHNLKLLPNPALLRSGDEAAAFAPPLAGVRPTQADTSRIRELVTASHIEELVARLSGATVVDGTRIVSRHIHHPDAARAVALVADELTRVGFTPQRHNFVHQGKVLPNVYAEVQGTGDSMIWVTAHLDSTANIGDALYVADRDPAPGADDDASGTAAVLAVAAAIAELAKHAAPTRTVRFALFNAEEHGLVGSGHFARMAAATGLAIDAVFQHDMIGHLPDGADRRFEIHSGYRADASVEGRSDAIAATVADCAAALAELGEAELYRTYDNPGGEDPADGRSDHTSFQRCGFPAVIVCENFFAGRVERPDHDVMINTTYHQKTDTSINAAYAASIARATALAVWTLANA